MLRLENVKKHYNNFELNCSLQVEAGCVTGLIGANGAGKSTTFKAILDLIRIDGGSIQIFGKDHQKLTLSEKEDIGVVMSNAGFYEGMSIHQIIPVLSSLYRRFDKETFLRRCEENQLPLKKQVREFSTGMRARLNLIIATSHEAKLLILDEPTAGLDVIARDALLDQLREYMETEERAVLISSHISSDLENFCDDMYMLHKGQIIMHEDMDTMRDSYGLLKLREEEFQRIDKGAILYTRKENFGIAALTNDRQFYQDNYPNLVIEKGSLDTILMIVEKGERL